MSIAPVLLALLALAAPGGAHESASPEVKEQVRELLGSIHGPVSPDSFRALGPDAELALAEFARSRNVLPSKRVRALEALAALGGDRALAVHRDVASGSAPSAVRRGAVRGLALLSGSTRALAALGPFVEKDRDPSVRAAAAEALAVHAPADGCRMVRARARVEADPARFGRALATCDRNAGAKPGAR